MRAAWTAVGAGSPGESAILGAGALVAAVLAVPVARAVGRRRRN
jgi:hypothetical protein